MRVFAEARMSESNRHGDVFYGVDGQPMFTGCRMFPTKAMPRCAYCEAESTRRCDAEGAGPLGRCGVRMCETHTTRVGQHHDLCREHGVGDHLETLKRGDTAQNVFWEIVEAKAVPIPGTERGRWPWLTFTPIRPTISAWTAAYA
jgi:hypothetical protein